MKNQLDYLHSLRIPAETLNSNTSSSDRQRIIGDLKAKNTNTKFLYITPEQAATDSFKELMKNLVRFRKVAYIAVDEAHCVSEWGHDFRKEYLKLGNLRKEYPELPWIALTATAPVKVKKDLIENLGLKGPPATFQVSCFRSNLYYDVAYKSLMQNDFIELKAYIEKCLGRDNPDTKPSEKSCGIIYCRKKDTTESVAKSLQKLGLRCGFFHSSMKKHEKETLQNDWMRGVVPVIVATVSFGMGIDKAQVRFVIHWDAPQSVSSWYQESGRAGRDGKYSFCRVYYDRDEVRSISFLLQQDIAKHKDKNKVQLEIAKASYEEFQRISEHCESTNCRHKLFTKFFGDSDPNCDNMCDACKDKKKCLKNLESFQQVTSHASLGSFRSKPDLDPADLYEGGRNNDFKKGSFESYDDGDSDHGSGFVRASDLMKNNDRSFIDKQFAIRKLQATAAMEQLPKTQINRVKSAQATEVKVSGLTISKRDQNLTHIIEALRKNVAASVTSEPAEHTSFPFAHDDYESIGVEIEYKCFSESKAISIYIRKIAKATKAIREHSGLCPEIKSYVPAARKSHGGEHKTVEKELKKRFGADVVDEIEAESQKKVERKKKNKLEQSGRDGLSQTNIKSFFGKPKSPDVKEEASSSSNDSGEIAKLELLKEVLKKELEETVVAEEEPDVIMKEEVIPMIMQSEEEVVEPPLIIDESPIDKGDGFAIESMKRKHDSSETEGSSSKRPRISEKEKAPPSAKANDVVKEIVSKIIIKELNPFYKDKKFESRDPKALFKAMARDVTHHFCQLYPNGGLQKPEVKKYIRDIFKSRRIIRSERDFRPHL